MFDIVQLNNISKASPGCYWLHVTIHVKRVAGCDSHCNAGAQARRPQACVHGGISQFPNRCGRLPDQLCRQALGPSMFEHFFLFICETQIYWGCLTNQGRPGGALIDLFLLWQDAQACQKRFFLSRMTPRLSIKCCAGRNVPLV